MSSIMHRNTFTFEVKNTETGEILRNNVIFFGIDSEDAHTNCIEWADKYYKFDCIADLVDGKIERDESRRKHKSQEQQMMEEVESRKNVFKSVLRKASSIQIAKEQ